LSIIDQFSKLLFYCHIPCPKLCVKLDTKYPIAHRMLRYTTLWMLVLQVLIVK